MSKTNAIDGGYFYKNTIEPATWIRDHGQNFLIRNDMEYVTKYVKNIVTDKDPVGTGLSQIKHDGEKLVRVDNNGYVSLNGYQEKQVKMRVFDAYIGLNRGFILLILFVMMRVFLKSTLFSDITEDTFMQ